MGNPVRAAFCRRPGWDLYLYNNAAWFFNRVLGLVQGSACPGSCPRGLPLCEGGDLPLKGPPWCRGTHPHPVPPLEGEGTQVLSFRSFRSYWSYWSFCLIPLCLQLGGDLLHL